MEVKESGFNLNEEEKKKLIILYYYMLDMKKEFIASYEYIKLYKIIISMRGESFINLINSGSKLLAGMEHLDLNQEKFKYQNKIIFNNMVMNITKIGDIKNQYRGVLKFVPKFNQNLNKFCNKFCTKELMDYRNKYVAHPSSKNNNGYNILTIEELEKLWFKILRIDELSVAKRMTDYIKEYIDGIYSNSLMGNNETLFNTYIEDFKKELEDLGINILN